MKKHLLLFLILLIPTAHAVFLEQGVMFHPTGTNANYTIESNVTVESVQVTSTCLIIDGNSICYAPASATNYNLSILYEDITLSGNKYIIPTTYFLNDTGLNGSIHAESNTIINFNNATIKGNLTGNSYGFYTTSTSRDNVTIMNAVFDGFARAIGLRNDDDFLIYSNILKNNTFGIRCVGNPCQNANISSNIFDLNTDTDIYGERLNNSLIEDNSLESVDVGIVIRIASHNNILSNTIISNQNTSGIGISLEDNSLGYHMIDNNTVHGFYYGIRIRYGNDGTIATNNKVKYSGLWGISTVANHTVIQGNDIRDIYWNSIFYGGDHNRIDSNYIDNYLHHGIDHHDDNDFLDTHYNNITNNFITSSTPNFGGISCMLHSQVYGSYVFNNTCSNLINTSLTGDSGRGITSEGNNTFANYFLNNTFYNISGYCAREGAWNNTWEGNNFTGCSRGEFIIRPLSYYEASQEINVIIRDNIYNNGIARIFQNNYPNNVTINLNETSAVKHVITKNNGGNVTFSYGGRKTVLMDNGTISFNHSEDMRIYNITSTRQLLAVSKSYTLDPEADQNYNVYIDFWNLLGSTLYSDYTYRRMVESSLAITQDARDLVDTAEDDYVTSATRLNVAVKFISALLAVVVVILIFREFLPKRDKRLSY